MKYIKMLVGAVFAAVLLTTVATASPSTNAPLTTPKVGPWSFGLSGGGNSTLSDSRLNNNAVSLGLQLGHTTTLVFPAELGVRQSVNYSDAQGGRSWSLGTKVYSDWTVIKLGSLQFDAGVNVGAEYGNQPFKWTAAPEIVTRLYLKKDVDIFARAEYPINLNVGRAENSLVYTFGIRIRL